MSEKQIKSWGKIGGVQSMQQSWSLPDDGWAFWPLYEKCSNYSEQVISGDVSYVSCMSGCFQLPHYPCDTPPCLTYFEFSLNTGQPLSQLTVKQGTAKLKPVESCCRYLDWRIFSVK